MREVVVLTSLTATCDTGGDARRVFGLAFAEGVPGC
jgi:hypothetical protein